MTTGYLDVEAVRDDDHAPAPATTLIRLLALLPPDWSCKESIGPNWIRLRITLRAPTTERTARDAVRSTLTDPALRGWKLTDLRAAA